MNDVIHSVTLDKELCKGCTNCIKRCPTEAIRVRRGKAQIIGNRCIDCGECIRICPHHAKKSVYDSLDALKKFELTIALPAPSLAAQFQGLRSVDVLLGALMKLGFDAVYEVAVAAEVISDATVRYMYGEDPPKPVISSACPTITRLIQIRFPDLLGNILPIITPAELAAGMAKQRAAKETGLPIEKIGAFFISPCPAKVTTVTSPVGLTKSNLDGAIAVKELYPKLLSAIKEISPDEELPVSRTGGIGLGWGITGGESAALLEEKYLAADGIDNCIRVLESIENHKVNAEFIELNACPGGCVGGVLSVENPFVAMARLKHLRNRLSLKRNDLSIDMPAEALKWSTSPSYSPALKLDTDIWSAIEKRAEVDRIIDQLRGLDCGSCGSPSCRAFAEDIVNGHSNMDECIFVLRESMHRIARDLAELSSWENKEDE